MTLTTTPFDAAEFLDTPEAEAEYLAAAFETGDAEYIKSALATLSRAHGMSGIAKDANVSRQSLYKSLSETGDPKLSTFLGVVKALGMTVSIQQAHSH